jgi:TolA-binding protein
MPHSGTEAVKLDRLDALAREATRGEVSEEAHLAGRARFIAAVDGERGRSRGGVGARWAIAMAAVAALVVGGWRYEKMRGAPEWTVVGAVASEGFVRAPEASPATIAFADGSAVVLAPTSRARVVRGDHRHVVLEAGRAEVRIARGPMLAWAFDAGPFTVRASQGSLAIALSDDGQQLDVWPHDAEATVQGGAAGPGVTLRGGDHLTARVREADLHVVRADGTEAATATPTPTPTPTSTPTATPTPTPTPHLSWPALLARGDYDTILHDADASGLDATLSHRPLSDLSALADASRYRGQIDTAQRALTAERARFPGSKEAHTAAFLLGRLADDQTHDAKKAVGWYDRYLAEAPQGPFASDALGRKMIAVQKSQGSDAARPIADLYARRFPHGAYAAQAEEIRGQ